MNSRSFGYASITMLVALTLVITVSPTNTGILEPSYSQPTFGTPTNPGSSSPDTTGTPDTSDTGSSTQTRAAEDEGKFQQFMECLFGGDASEEDVSDALDSSNSNPTEQEIRDCFEPLYNTGGATGSTTADGSSSTDETEDADANGGESSTNDGTSSDEDESEE